MKIYVASSWRNQRQSEVVSKLRAAHHEVYDFRNPAPGDFGFHWEEIDTDWQKWTPKQYCEALRHPIAEDGYNRDYTAMKWAEVFVMVMPCGRSVHLKLAWACVRGLPAIILLDGQTEPELMYKLATHICLNMDDVLTVVEHWRLRREAMPYFGLQRS